MTTKPPDRRFALGALAALLALGALQWTAVARQSLVGDAPYHLLAGHQALRYGENRLNLEHPPLVKLVAALPLLGGEPLAPPLTVDRVLAESPRVFDDPARLGRVRITSRLLVLAAFGLPLLGAAYLLGRRVDGAPTGVVLALMLGLSFCVLPYLGILQTDAAVALGVTFAVWAALGYLDAPGPGRAVLLGLGLGLALSAKFSGVLAVPPAALALVLVRGRPATRRLADAAVVSVVAAALLWATYAVANRRYDPAAGRDTIARYCRGEALIVDQRMRSWEDTLLRVERVSPAAAQWLTGFVGVRLQNEIGVYPSYAFGHLSSRGRWWFFPAVLLVRTPLVILVAGLAALVCFWRRRRERSLDARTLAVTGGTAAVCLGLAMASSYNLGVRHLLPILPLLYLPAARWTAARPWRAVAVVGLLLLEAVALAPLWMSATNTWWLGRFNPTRWAFSVGDAEYRQNFLALSAAADERGIETLRMLYPLVSEREIAARVPGARAARPGEPLEPGWYAVSVMLEQYLPVIPRTRPEDVRGHAGLAALAREWEPYLRELVARSEDHGYVAGTFHLYRLDES